MHTTARVNELKCVSLAKSLKALNHNLKVIWVIFVGLKLNWPLELHV